MATRRADGLWDVPVDDEVAMRIATERLTNETDDDVVSRPVRAAIGCAARLTDRHVGRSAAPAIRRLAHNSVLATRGGHHNLLSTQMQ